MSGKFSMDDYIDVAERHRIFLEQFPEGRLQSEIIELSEKRVVVKAYAYRSDADTHPGIGHSSLGIPGTTPYTKGSELENAETSAWGRAIIACGIPSKKIASANEVRNKSGQPAKEVPGEGQQGTDSAGMKAGGAKPQEAATPSATFTIPDKAKPNNRPVDGAEKQLASEQVIEKIQALLPDLAALRKVDEADVVKAIEADNGPLHLLDEGPALALLAKMTRWEKNLRAAA